ncbi:hypothetical protein ACFQ0O_23010 [Saccharopolyspora spinosporotrichia]
MLALIGQPPTSLEGRGGFQDQSGLAGSLDGPALFSTVSRFCERVDKPDAIADLLPRAVRAALREEAPPFFCCPRTSSRPRRRPNRSIWTTTQSGSRTSTSGCGACSKGRDAADPP